MKIKISVTTLMLCLNLFVFTSYANAQATSMAGPTNAGLTPPASASAVNEVLGYGAAISIKIGSTIDPSVTDINYQWYKLDSTGVKHLVQSSNNATMLETPAGAGYYTYQLTTGNSNLCTSEISDPFNIYVLPALNPTIAASSSTICANGTSTSTLTTNPGSNKFSYLYQWSLSGSDISGATSATYAATATNANNNTYTVRVSYALSTSTKGTASQVVNVVPVPSKPTISAGL